MKLVKCKKQDKFYNGKYKGHVVKIQVVVNNQGIPMDVQGLVEHYLGFMFQFNIVGKKFKGKKVMSNDLLRSAITIITNLDAWYLSLLVPAQQQDQIIKGLEAARAKLKEKIATYKKEQVRVTNKLHEQHMLIATLKSQNEGLKEQLELLKSERANWREYESLKGTSTTPSKHKWWYTDNSSSAIVSYLMCGIEERYNSSVLSTGTQTKVALRLSRKDCRAAGVRKWTTRS
eukprot:m51a1_g6749 hypothetical protein (231) ;mRNA; r:3212-17864